MSLYFSYFLIKESEANGHSFNFVLVMTQMDMSELWSDHPSYCFIGSSLVQPSHVDAAGSIVNESFALTYLPRAAWVASFRITLFRSLGAGEWSSP